MKNRYISVLPCSDTWTYSLQHIRYTKRSPHTQTPSDALVIMNTCLSHNGGTALIQQIRQMNPMPILALSEIISMADKAAVLKCGADDVLNKPYNLEECLARAQALMRRYTQFNHITGRNYALVSHGNLMLDTARRQVSIGNETREQQLPIHFLLEAMEILQA